MTTTIYNDKTGEVIASRDEVDEWHECTRDEAGRELTYRDSKGFSYERTYDAAGNILTRRDNTTDEATP